MLRLNCPEINFTYIVHICERRIRESVTLTARAPLFIIPHIVQLSDRSGGTQGAQNLNTTVKDKVVIVTGAGGGIGRDFALAFAADGAKVVVNDVGRSSDEPAAQKVAAEIAAAGSRARANTHSDAER